jgi:nucleoside-diphosphate-sugar epimerase
MDIVGRAVTPILVTGARGYLGGRVMERAAREGIPVVGVSRRGAEGTIACDLRDSGAVLRIIRDTGATAAIHCAAAVPERAADYQDESAARDSFAMVEALCAARPARVVFASSMTVYPRDVRMPVAEDDAGAAETAYGAAKHRAERMLLSTLDDVLCLRLPGLFGPPRRNGLLYNAALAFAEGRVPVLNRDPPVWAALHVEDAADLCLRAALYPRPMRDSVNAGYPGPVSVGRAVAALAGLFGCAVPEMGAGPEFEMDLSRLAASVGLPDRSFEERLAELARSARQAA